MTRRSNGEGTAPRWNEERQRWESKVTIDGQRRIFRARTKTDLRAKINRAHEQIGRDGFLAEGNLTATQLIDRWVEAEVFNGRGAADQPQTRAAKLVCVTKWKAVLGAKRVRSLTTDDLDAALRSLAAGEHGSGKPLGRSAVRKLAQNADQVFGWAHARRYLAYNIAAGMSRPATPEPKQKQALTPEQLRAFWNAIGDARLGNYFRLLAATGLRPGEGLALSWSAVDLDEGTLIVSAGVQVVPGGGTRVGQTKTTGSVRAQRLDPVVIEALRDQRVRVAQMRLAASRWVDHDLVFPTVNGGNWTPRNMRRDLDEALDAAGLPRIVPSQLRTTVTTLASDAGLRLEDIADAAGHSTRTAERYYRNKPKVVGAEVASVMGAIVNSAT